MVGVLVDHPFYRYKSKKSYTMKIKVGLFIYASILALFSLGGCQEEVIEIVEPLSESVINNQSPLADLVQQATMSDGSFDNIIDHSSCITVKLPVTVIANEQEIVISTTDDLKLIERVFDKSETDEDVLEIIFPIVVIMADHTEVIVNNDDELEDLIEDCIEGGDDDDIECIDFAYPLNISIYNVANQISDVVIIENDEELFKLFESLDENELVSFNFPLKLVLTDGTEVTVQDNNELEHLIKDFGDECDEDDDNDFDDDDVDDSNLQDILLDGTWVVTYFFDENDETTDFEGFRFEFFEEGWATATHNDQITEGTWNTYGDDGELELEMNFGTESPLDELHDDWTIIEFDEHIIRLMDVSDDGSEEFLTFERPTDGGEELTVAMVIVEGQWLVANYNDSGVDETASFAGFTFTFAEDGTALATNGTDTIAGTWSEVKEGETHKLVLDFGSTVPFDEFADDWNVVEFSETRIDLNDISGGDGTTDILVFEKI